MDDTFIIQKEIHKWDFLQHINSIDPTIQFTVENNKVDGAIPFLDTIVKTEADGNLYITVYRKPTHTDQYLQWDSHHHLSAKFCAIHTLTHRAQTVCTTWAYLQREGPPQEGTNPMQISHIGFGQGGEKAQQALQDGYWWG